MKISVFGVGSVAGVVAARMARAGVDGLTLVARGQHLDTMRRNGLSVRDSSGEWSVPVNATDDTPAIGVQDILFLGLKAHSIAPALPQIAPLVGPETIIVPMLNGIPWWYFFGLGDHASEPHLDSVDPGGRIWRALPPEQVLGCVVYIGSNVAAPGVIEHNNGGTYIIGEPDGKASDRTATVASLFEAADLPAPVSDDIRGDIWTKLWGNLSSNPMSVVCEANCLELADDAGLSEAMAGMMREGLAVAQSVRPGTTLDVDDRLRALRSLGPIATSMLQDYRAGKSLEIDALLGVICELGRRSGIETPRCDLIYALAKFKAERKTGVD
ncbi:MAG: 2-dehydropantoate 2-reductase [Pseudomonadota bacterium]